MIRQILTLSIATSLLITFCNTKTVEITNKSEQETPKEYVKTVKSKKDVPFKEAKNYFVKNTFKAEQLTTLKITSEKDFDDIFGMATTMGPNGKPTDIDFSKQFVLAVIGQPTDKSTTLTPQSLKQNGNTITFTYKLKEGGKQSYTMQPLLLVIVDNKYQGKITFEKIQTK